MPRDDLMDILRRIAACPENDGRNIIAAARTCTGPGDLRAYVWAQWMRLGEGSKRAVAKHIERLAHDNRQVAA
jgi:hypothetical protein